MGGVCFSRLRFQTPSSRAGCMGAQPVWSHRDPRLAQHSPAPTPKPILKAFLTKGPASPFCTGTNESHSHPSLPFSQVDAGAVKQVPRSTESSEGASGPDAYPTMRVTCI